MKTLSAGDTLVVASHNPGKVWEIKHLIKPYGLNAVSAGDLNLPEPDETETTFAGNSELKAAAAAKASGHPALADDSGLEVAALNGAPGIYSARWAEPGKDFQRAMQRIADEVREASGPMTFDWQRDKPQANFICALCLAWPDGSAQHFEGRVDGHLVWPPRGGNGFGYDPMFIADGMTDTFGEIEPEAKHAVSHRRRAFDAFKQQCLANLPLNSVVDDDAIEGLRAAAANLSTQQEFGQFVHNLRAHLSAASSTGTDVTRDGYLKAVETWSKDASVSDDEPRWRTLAKALLAASLDK